jgi:hypothetical protein
MNSVSSLGKKIKESEKQKKGKIDFMKEAKD